MWRKGNPFALLVEMQFGAAIVESDMELPEKNKIGTILLLSSCTSGTLCIFEETQNTNLKEYKHPYVHCSVIYNSQDLEAAQMSVDEWIEQLSDIYTIKYYSTIKMK